jgi:ribonuclease I
MSKSQFLMLFTNAYPKVHPESLNLLLTRIKKTEIEVSLTLALQLANKFSKSPSATPS